MTCMAQEEGGASTPKKADKKPKYEVSFVVVGARSDGKWIGDGPGMVVKAYDPGAAPPSNIFISTGKKDRSSGSQEKKRKRLRLTLNTPTERVKLGLRSCELAARYQSGKIESFKKFTTAILPAQIGEYTVFMARQPRRKNWSDPLRVVMSDHKIKFPAGSLRVVNMSDRPVVVQRGKKIMGNLPPRKSVVIKAILSMDKPETITLWYKDKGRKFPAFRRELKLSADLRYNVACTYVPKQPKPIRSHLFMTPMPPVLPPVTKK